MYIPVQSDINRYKELSQLRKIVNNKLTKMIPKPAIKQVATALGFMRGNQLSFDSEEQTNILMDYCIHDWVDGNGKNVVQKYAERSTATVGSEEHQLVQAFLEAQYRVLLLKDVVPGAGAYCKDVLSEEELFLMDIGLSNSLGVLGSMLAARTVSAGGYSVTTGVVVPIVHDMPATKKEEFISSIRDVFSSIKDPHQARLAFIRTLLNRGALDNVRYEEPHTTGTGGPQQRGSSSLPFSLPTFSVVTNYKPRPYDAPPRNAPCPCGSGQKYKKCCESKDQA